MRDEDLTRLLGIAVTDLRSHFDVAADDLAKRIRVLTEGVVRFDQKVDRTAGQIRDEMRRGFAETEAVIKGCPVASREA